MNYNEEMMQEFKKIGIKAKLIKLKPEQKGTPEDWKSLEKKITIYARENEMMLEKSIQYSSNSVIL